MLLKIETPTARSRKQHTAREGASKVWPLLVAHHTMHYAAKPKSRPIAEKRDGTGVGLPGTGSPRKTLALERWIVHAIAAYHRRTSSEGSRPKATARLVANFLTKPTVSLAQKPWRSNDNAQKSKGCIRRWVCELKIG